MGRIGAFSFPNRFLKRRKKIILVSSLKCLQDMKREMSSDNVMSGWDTGQKESCAKGEVTESREGKDQAEYLVSKHSQRDQQTC